MLIRHFIPPPERRTGGLDTALTGLDAALRAAGVDSLLVSGTAWTAGEERVADGQAIAHFHGLWEPSHWLLSGNLKRSGVRVVVSPHGMLEPWAFRHRGWKKRPVFHLIEKRRLQGADAVLATSRLEAENLERLIPGLASTVLPLGVDSPPECASAAFRAEARAALNLETGGRMALFLSRIHPIKGVDLLLTAWGDLAGEVASRRAVLFVVGPGEEGYAGKCRALAEDCQARGAAVRWIGPVWGEARWRYFAAADLFCLPSRSENFGLVGPEAWLCGTEVLTTDRTPWAEQAGREGLTITAPECDAVRAALAAWLRRGVLGPGQRSALAAWGRESFSWPRIVPRYVEFYAGFHR